MVDVSDVCKAPIFGTNKVKVQRNRCSIFIFVCAHDTACGITILPAVASPPKRVFSRFTVSTDQFNSVMKFRKQNRSVDADASCTVHARNYSGFVSILFILLSSVCRFCFQFESNDAITFWEMSLRSFVEISCVHNAEFGCFCRKWFRWKINISNSVTSLCIDVFVCLALDRVWSKILSN